MKETDLVRQIIKHLNYNGHLVQRTQSGMVKVTNKYGSQHMMKFAKAGTADITGCTSTGRFLAVECKVGKNIPTDKQNAYLEEVMKRGGLAVLAYSLDDVIKAGL